MNVFVLKIFNKLTVKETLLMLLSLCLLLVLGGLHELVNPVLRFDRLALQHGESWRLITAHLVHVNMNHALLNTAGFCVAMIIVGGLLRVWQWCLSLVFMMLFISSLLFYFSAEVQWYVGFSGVLHGILMLGFLSYVYRGDFVFVFATVLLLGKIVREQLPSFNAMHLHSLIEAPVVVDAHLYGIFAGTLLSLVFLFIRRRKLLENTNGNRVTSR